MQGLNESQTAEKEAISAKINKIGKDVLAYQNKVVKDNPKKLVAKIIKMSSDVQIPEAPKNEEGEPINKNFAYEYFRDHFFDNIDLTDDRLVNTPVLQNKIEYFYSKNMLAQHPDTIIKYVFPIINSIPEESMMYRFIVTNVTTHFEKSNLMGMDKVKTHMVNSFYCAPAKNGEPKAHWMDQTKLKE